MSVVEQLCIVAICVLVFVLLILLGAFCVAHVERKRTIAKMERRAEEDRKMFEAHMRGEIYVRENAK
jgi:hypothetical protein